MARHPSGDVAANTVLRFRVTRREFDILLRVACASSVTVSRLISEAVAEYASDLEDSPELRRAFVRFRAADRR
jgi:hypothetical protein